jgi:hypothetical protein
MARLRYNPSNSPVWNDLIKVKDLYVEGRIVEIGNGEDRFLGGPLVWACNFKRKI